MELEYEQYDELLDALDGEDKNEVLLLFYKFELKPSSELLDAPRMDINNNELYTYLDYAISHSLNEIIDLFIDELGLEYEEDELMAKTLKLDNPEMYKYLSSLGYFAGSETLKIAVQKSCSEIVAHILENDSGLVAYLEEEDIDELMTHLDEETIETVRVLINNDVDANLFCNHLEALKEQTNDEDDTTLDDGEKDVAIELIDLFENLDIAME
jgi:hypothetical protein